MVETSVVAPPCLEIGDGDGDGKLLRHLQPSRFSFDFSEYHPDVDNAGLGLGLRLPFFSTRSHRSGDTWIVSLFLFVHVVAFAATMAVNDCAEKSHGDCTVKVLGRFSFQPLSENPLLGPSASTMDLMGALRRSSLTANREIWRMFTCPWLHAGAIHLFVNLVSTGFIGIHLEEEFGPLRIGVIYILSALFGSLVGALFVRDGPAVSSSAALFGLLGAVISSLLCNWKLYTGKTAVVILISTILMNRKFDRYKGGLFDFDSKTSSMKLKQKLDKPVMRIVSLLLFLLLVLGSVALVIRGTDGNEYCSWCRYVDCIPLPRWSCRATAGSCKASENGAGWTLTCTGNGNYKVYPYADLSRERVEDLCSLIC
ncbi:hypothetical protein MLD38_013020 [Melastoma candidum]|uniref:Uncharacterized protein n=1 Tax=Melastoma candidum TaxID=119954 RepID=A0ACB9R8U0_9MYRT|nr:hypothetical protein MLD38_013020 [Melastoma candidum]